VSDELKFVKNKPLVIIIGNGIIIDFISIPNCNQIHLAHNPGNSNWLKITHQFFSINILELHDVTDSTDINKLQVCICNFYTLPQILRESKDHPHDGALKTTKYKYPDT